MAYLLTANWLIYYRLGRIGLEASDNQHIYVINDQLATSSAIIYVALGDSLTAGVGTINYQHSYAYLVAQKIADATTKVFHHNHSFPGARTQDIIDTLLDKAIEDKPDVVTLLVGINDIHGRVSAAKFRKNYETILTRLSTETTAKINIISIPQIGTNSLLWPPFNYYYQARIDKFNGLIREMADSYDLNYINLPAFPAQPAGQLNPYYSSDNFHPSDLGYQFWSQTIYEHLNK
jgi:lysophospholipase L1-like esterase